ncbi:MAG: rhodanese-like domain-containing protein, partial [Nitrospinota bacterium]
MERKGYKNRYLLWPPEELHARLADPNVLAIDTRPARDYARGHIPGAAHFDLYHVGLNDTRPEPLAAFLWMVTTLMEARGVDYGK